ncbi:hypothetical protein JOM56_000156 [Amanita muscaria]
MSRVQLQLKEGGIDEDEIEEQVALREKLLKTLAAFAPAPKSLKSSDTPALAAAKKSELDRMARRPCKDDRTEGEMGASSSAVPAAASFSSEGSPKPASPHRQPRGRSLSPPPRGRPYESRSRSLPRRVKSSSSRPPDHCRRRIPSRSRSPAPPHSPGGRRGVIEQSLTPSKHHLPGDVQNRHMSISPPPSQLKRGRSASSTGSSMSVSSTSAASSRSRSRD